MDAHNGGLLLDFRPIRRYGRVAPGENHYERVRTVLDWIAFAVPLGLVTAREWPRSFARPEDLGRFVDELRRFDLDMDLSHLAAFREVGLLPRGPVSDYAALADAIDDARAQREAA